LYCSGKPLHALEGLKNLFPFVFLAYAKFCNRWHRWPFEIHTRSDIPVPAYRPPQPNLLVSDRPNNRPRHISGNSAQFSVVSLAQLAAAVPEIRVFEASVKIARHGRVFSCDSSAAMREARSRVSRAFEAIEDVHQLAGLLGGEAAIINCGGDRGRRYDDIVRVVDCRQRAVERSAGASRH
jgi:hypothetical protein